MTFASPAWLYALAIIPVVIVVMVIQRAMKRRAIESVVSARVADAVFPGRSASGFARGALRLLGVAAIVVALARPQSGVTEIEEITKTRDIFIAVDVSKSMLTQDVSPNRLQQARFIAADLVDHFPDDRISIISFAGAAAVAAPLTLDHSAVLETIDQLDVTNIPVGGSELASPIRVASESMTNKELSGALLVMLTDGEDTQANDQSSLDLSSAEDRQIKLLAVGIGTDEGDPIPDPDRNGRPVVDRSGKTVISRLDRASLNALAKHAGGHAVFTGSSSVVIAAATESMVGMQSTETSQKAQQAAIERFAIPLALGIGLAALSLLPGIPLPGRSRRSRPYPTALLAIGAIALGVLPNHGHAQETANEQIAAADNHWKKGHHEDALTAYRNALAADDAGSIPDYLRHRVTATAGSAAYRLERFDEATEWFGQSLASGTNDQRADAEYNLANSLVMGAERPLADEGATQDLEKLNQAVTTMRSALPHYDDAIRHRPSFDAATENREKVQARVEELEKMIEELEKQQPQEQEQQDDQQDQKKDDQNKDQQKESDQEQQSGDQQEKSESGDEQSEQEQQDGEQEGEQEPTDQSGENQDEQPGEQGEPKDDQSGEQQGDQEGQEQPGEGQESDQNKPGDASQGQSKPVNRAAASGLTKEQLEAMTQEQREDALEKIREQLRARANEATGVPLRRAPSRARQPEKNW